MTIGKVHTATEVGRNDPTHTEEHRILIVGKVAAKEQERLLRRFDVATANITKAAEHIERELSVPVESKASLNVASEIRAHSRSLDSKAVDFVRERINSGDDLSVSAVLGAPSYLSGLSDEMRTVLTRQWHERQNPALVQRLTLMRATLDKLNTDAGKVFIEMEKAVGADPSKVRNIGAAHEAAQAALRIEPTV
ncbi:hypothetical protein [Croceibacterium ferulae]|uniref:hypothetical protein n=1 Tax=Croceibacterium ferulae TaxID=1854641 RepID=UPI000F8920EC|nr:hypothetical protein [Croceibacterium ferulae]